MGKGIRQHHGDAYHRTPNRLKLGAWLSGCSHGKVRVQHSHICSSAAAKPRETKEEMTSTRLLGKSSNNPRLLTLGPSHSSAPLSNPSQDAGIQAPRMFSIFIFIYISPSPSVCSEPRQCISYDPNLGEPETSAVWGLEHLSGR